MVRILELSGLAAAGALLLAGCVASRPNPVQQAADAMVGKPISVAIQAFGPPTLNLPPCSYCTDGGTYAWDNTRISRQWQSRWVQTGTQTSQRVVGRTQGGHGIAPMLITEDVTTPVGENRMVQVDNVDFLCNIQAFTDMKDVIKSIDVVGCTAADRY
ncbi:hypothetical protein [Inquilinus sp. Marseille-Q2685]|uniref:hypothetical protein n=1 Tax=Inquilinus sp. Marseille-Q2685 TaxID=2866581 RepID=UPI001CE48407|nr:hypothetical protein [Inquilinus sp. Marseille-Q2685]